MYEIISTKSATHRRGSHVSGEWVLGYMQSRNRYRSEEELMGVVRKQRKLQIPMDVIILDYYHWDDQGFGSFVFDEEAFPDPGEMIKTLHEEYNCKLLVSVCPSFTPGNKNWNLFKRKAICSPVKSSKIQRDFPGLRNSPM